MQFIDMEIYEIAYLFLGLATFVAAWTIINYSRKRSAATSDPDIKKAFRPLYIFAVGLIVFAIGCIMTFWELYIQIPWLQIEAAGEPVDTFYYTLYIVILVQLTFFAISASIIMQQKLIGIFMEIMLGIAYLLMFNAILIFEEERVSNIARSYIQLGNVLTMIIFAAVAILFAWIAWDTRRSTSMSLAYAMGAQALAVPIPALLSLIPTNPDLYTIPVTNYSTAISMIALMGPAMIAFAFLRPDQKISGELLGYGAAFAAPAIVLASLISTAMIPDIMTIIISVFGVIAIMFASGTASYTYGRWRETKQTPTALLMMSFAAFTIGQAVGMLGSIGTLDPLLSVYIDFFVSSFALTLFCSVAILSAGYRTASAFPWFIYIPAIVLIMQLYPAPIYIAFLTYVYLAVPTMILYFIPVVLFPIVSRRMKNAGSKGYLRPLGLAIGLLIFMLVRYPFFLIDYSLLGPGYAMVSAAFVLLWLATTGRLKRN
ncbi:MAG: hypothetical protein ACFFEV_06850 [Candidatus Thorarchaeota archaeon]